MPADLSSPPPAGDLARPLLLAPDPWSGRLTVTGELSRETAHLLPPAVALLALGNQRTWTVDAAGITFCDAAGLRALAQARSAALSRGRVLVLERPGRFLLRLLDAVGMGQLAQRPPTAA